MNLSTASKYPFLPPRAVALLLALGLLLDITGALHVYGLGALMGSWLALGTALLLALLAGGWLWIGSRHDGGRRGLAELWRGLASLRRVAALLMLLAWLATVRDFWIFVMPGGPPALLAAVALGALPLMWAVLRPPPAGWLLLLAVLLGSLARLAGYAAVPIEPQRGDMLPLVQGALDNLLRGSSPYAIYRMPWELPLTYLPLTWLAYLPPFLLGLDIRLTNLIADLAVGAVLLWQGRRMAGTRAGVAAAALLWGWVFLLPTMQHWSHVTTAPVWWALLAAELALLAAGRDRLASVGLGLCAAASPLTLVLAPFAGLRWLRAHGLRAALALAALSVLVAAALVLPFLLWAPEPFVYGTLRWFNDNELFPRLRWEMDNTWASQVGFSGAFWRRGLEGLLKPIQLALLAGTAALFWRCGAPAARLAHFVTAALLLFTVFNPVLWPYLYTPALIAALSALGCTAQDRSQEPEDGMSEVTVHVARRSSRTTIPALRGE